MDKKSKNTLIISIIALALVLIGVTYAYFSARITGLESASTITIGAGHMRIEYSEGDESATVNNIYPRSEEWLTKTITLTGYNSTSNPMQYDLGLNITTNTFKGGQLTLSLTGVGSNGAKIADIESKSITGQNRFFKIGTGSFNQSNGDTHVYTLKIYFKDNGKDQNFNQDAVFNAKIHVREQGSQVAKATQNHNGKHCYTNDYVPNQTVYSGTTYVNGQYTYRYNMFANSSSSWANYSAQQGWGVKLTDKTSTDPVTTELCAYVNEKPVVNLSNMFTDTQATSIDFSSFDTSNVISMDRMFDSSKATSLDLSSFDTSRITKMDFMFVNSKATSIDLSSFDTSNVTNMCEMFWGSRATSLDLSSFDTSNVTNMSQMFEGSYATNIDLSSFDTSNVTNMANMFSSSKVTSLDLSGFDTSNVTNMNQMFSSTKMSTIDLSSFDTLNVTRMENMFYQSQATSLDLSSFDTTNVTNMSLMFNGCLNLTTIYVSDMFTVSSLAADSSSPINGSYNMFLNSTGLVGGAGTTFDSNYVNKVRAHIDGGTSNPGYFTDIKDKPSS